MCLTVVFKSRRSTSALRFLLECLFPVEHNNMSVTLPGVSSSRRLCDSQSWWTKVVS